MVCALFSGNVVFIYGAYGLSNMCEWLRGRTVNNDSIVCALRVVCLHERSSWICWVCRGYVGVSLPALCASMRQVRR
jgi:hypothetical protein